MKRKFIFGIALAIVLCISIYWVATPKTINAAKVINIVQSNYRSITINDKQIEAFTKQQYLIDDFIPRLSVYTIKPYKGQLPEKADYRVDILRNDGLMITLMDNSYIVIGTDKYEIVDGSLALGNFYKFID